MHNWAFQKNELPFVYFSWPLSPEYLAEYMVSMKTLPVHGCSLTMPYKQKTIPYIDDLGPHGLSTGSINTLYWKDGYLCGENTDCQGFMASLTQRSIVPRSALVLGAGGAAMSCIHGLKHLGCHHILVTSRNQESVKTLKYKCQLHFQELAWSERASLQTEMLINATPVGMSGKLAERSPFPETGLYNFKYVYDLIYNPVRTRLLRKAQKAGCKIINGLDMFILQAKAQFFLWTGKSFSVKAARDLLQEKLKPGK